MWSLKLRSARGTSLGYYGIRWSCLWSSCTCAFPKIQTECLWEQPREQIRPGQFILHIYAYMHSYFASWQWHYDTEASVESSLKDNNWHLLSQVMSKIHHIQHETWSSYLHMSIMRIHLNKGTQISNDNSRNYCGDLCAEHRSGC